MEERLKELILKYDPEFFNNLDENLKIFCREIRKLLRNEEDCVIAVTGYPGKGKSNDTAIIGALIDDDYSFSRNICFIPTSKEIENRYMNLKKYSFLHIDEASKGLHKQQWYDKMQQKLNTLYDTERENHYLCSVLIMPRFQNFTENFRNFRIVYWIHIIAKGVCIVFRKDEDKDTKDPWHIDENYKMKKLKWKGKKIFQRTMSDIIRSEQSTTNYWFYFKIPAIPKEVWEIYQNLKRDSRKKEKEDKDLSVESYRDKIQRERMERWEEVKRLINMGYDQTKIAIKLGITERTVRNYLKSMKTYEEIKGEENGGAERKVKDNRILNKL